MERIDLRGHCALCWPGGWYGASSRCFRHRIRFAARQVRLCLRRYAWRNDERKSLQSMPRIQQGAAGIITDSAEAFAQLAADHPEMPRLLVEHGRTALAQASAAFFRHSERKLHATGVTGTNGKTTTAFLIESAAERPRLALRFWLAPSSTTSRAKHGLLRIPRLSHATSSSLWLRVLISARPSL